jgi:DNA mismatch repair protein MutL
VRDLFHNRPARRKHLASSKAEFARISALCSRYALCHPDVAVSLSHDGRETFSTPGTGYTDALLGVYGRTVAGQSTTLSATWGENDREGAGEEEVKGGGRAERRVEGVLCYPAVTRATRDHVHVAVDGRPLTDGVLREAVVAGYGSLLPSGRAPVAVVSVTVPPGTVDHNVHPAKATVDLRDEGVVGAVERAVHDAISTADLRRSGEVAMDLESTLEPVEGESRLGSVSVIGQFRELYLLCADGDDLLVVDQHAAHERVNYERLRAAVDGVPSEPVDPPATLSVSPAEAALVDARGEALRGLGYDAATFGGGTVRVSAVPAPLGRTAAPESLRDVLATLESAGDGGTGSAARTVDDARETLLKDLACHPSLKAGDTLSDGAAEALVRRLGACEQPYACPHGRPTVLSIGEETLARGFERGNTRLG